MKLVDNLLVMGIRLSEAPGNAATDSGIMVVMQSFILAGGCFWCLEAPLSRIKGVASVTSGYATSDKHLKQPDYYQVATGQTSFIEAVQVDFDQSVVPETAVLDIYFMLHDPTSYDQQGADKGPQYRSAMFFQSQSQRILFEETISRRQADYAQPIVTEIRDLGKFYPAEAEHQDYYDNHPEQMYCQLVIAPKLAKLRSLYAKLIDDN